MVLMNKEDNLGLFIKISVKIILILLNLFMKQIEIMSLFLNKYLS
jgi:hypothetical protein